MTKRFYISGEGSLWRVSLNTIRSAKTYEEILGAARRLKVTETRRGWPESSLPAGVYIQEDGRLASWSNAVVVIWMDAVEDAVSYWSERV